MSEDEQAASEIPTGSGSMLAISLGCLDGVEAVTSRPFEPNEAGNLVRILGDSESANPGIIKRRAAIVLFAASMPGFEG